MDGQAITYATPKDWLDIMKNRSKIRMHELIERLGLRAKWSSNKRGKTNFESVMVREMVSDMADMVATLPKEPDELVKFLSREGSLKREVTRLLETHGSRIWGRTGDREHLLAVGEPGVEEGIYPRDLYFENDEDKELIRTLLHWWMGLKACNVILARERLDRERKKKEESRKARVYERREVVSVEDSAAAPASLVTLARGGTSAPPLNANVVVDGLPISATEGARHLHTLQVETASRGSPISTTVFTPHESSESPIVKEGSSGFTAMNAQLPQQAPTSAQSILEGVWNRLIPDSELNGSRHGSISSQPTANTNTTQWTVVHDTNSQQQSTETNATQAAASRPGGAEQSAMRQLNAELSKLLSDFTPGAEYTQSGSLTEEKQNGNAIYRGLDSDTVQALRAYIYNENTSVVWNEDALLIRIETIWRDRVRMDFNRIFDNIPVFIARERAFLTWIELKRHLAALERADKRWQKEGTTTAEIERRIQQHRTLMGASQALIRNFEDIGQSLEQTVRVDRDELLRQAFVVLAGEKYAVEAQWAQVEFATLMKWLGEHLEVFKRDDEELAKKELWYLG